MPPTIFGIVYKRLIDSCVCSEVDNVTTRVGGGKAEGSPRAPNTLALALLFTKYYQGHEMKVVDLVVRYSSMNACTVLVVKNGSRRLLGRLRARRIWDVTVK
jgi:hypothetical protein